MTLPASLLFQCFLRSYLVGAAFNPLGLQNVGFLYAIDPGLSALYRDEEALREARLRHAKNYNSHPFFTPFLLAAYLRAERDIALGRYGPETFVDIKETAANTLSGIGDSFFNGTCLNAWALTSAILICLGLHVPAFLLLLALFVLVQLFKLVTFIMGCRYGMGFLFFMKRLDLINWGDRLKYLNAALLAIFLAVALPEANGLAWSITGIALFLFGWVIGMRHVDRVVLALLLVLLVVTLHLSGFLDDLPGHLFQQWTRPGGTGA